MGEMINVAKNSWGKRSSLRVGGPLHKGDGCERLDLMSQPTRLRHKTNKVKAYWWVPAQEEAVQQVVTQGKKCIA